MNVLNKMQAQQTILGEAKGLVNFINRSPSPFHAVNVVRERLLETGFREIREEDSWRLKPNDRVFVTRNESTVVAVAIGGQYRPGNGFSIVGAHTDSPCLKVKPLSERKSEGYVQLGVETYGGGLWYTWFDRDLTVAGRCIVRKGDQLQHRLVHINRPVLRVPSLAIHLDRTANESFHPNKETHLAPVLCTTAQEQINKGVVIKQEDAAASVCSPTVQPNRHAEGLIRLLSRELAVKEEDLLDLELCLADTQPAAIGGLLEEFIFAPRLDNLFNSYTAIEGLIGSLDSLSNDTNIRLACLYDNEEVGSQSAQGAGSAITELLMRRLTATLTSEMASGATNGPSPVVSLAAYEEAVAKSFLVSADQAHAVHPNYGDKHEKAHKPQLHGGIVLKVNANQRYASTALTTAIIKEVAKRAEVPLQEFVVRQDMACGSTIGPILSAGLGMSTVDLGGPMLSMHSCREMACTSSVGQSTRLFKAFYEHFPSIKGSIQYE